MNLYELKDNTCKGFSLIEVLVSFFLLAFLLLATSELQLITLRHTRAVYYAGIASQQMKNMAEHLRQGHQINDYFRRWQEQNQFLLPQGNGTVTLLASGYKINVFWGAHKQMNKCTPHVGQSGCVEMMV